MINYKAGAPIAAGGFGCVFKPPLLCNDQDLNYSNTGISKLMYTEHAEQEMKEINKVKLIIKQHIKNYQNYFIMDDINICKPAALKETDKRDFDKKCRNFDSNINKKNINNNLNKLAIINIPDGGEEINDYFKNFVDEQVSLSKIPTLFQRMFLTQIENNFKEFIMTNNSLIELLINGIIPLNKQNFLHLDIKGENILKKNESGKIYTRLIDWGLSGSFKPGEIPNFVKNKVLQYNLPFGIILFSTNYKLFIKNNWNKLGSKQIAYRIYNNSRRRSDQHDKYIREFIIEALYKWGLSQQLTSLNFLKVDNFLPEDLIVDNLAIIIHKFTDNEGNFDDIGYFDTVFTKNADIYGFLSCYIQIVLETEIISNNKDLPNNLLISKIWMILVEYCFSTKYATKPIPINIIKKKLRNLNSLLLKSSPISHRFGTRTRKSGETKKSKCVSYKLSSGKKRCSNSYRRSSKNSKICNRCK